jgi:hypothetical protein
MAYRWSLNGPAFEFPTPYNTERRFLVWRGYALIGLAIMLVLLLSYLGSSTVEVPVEELADQPEGGSPWPHVLAAFGLAALGGLDLYRVSATGVLLLAPGEPASLTGEVRREGSGTSPGSAGLKQILATGQAMAPEVTGRYSAWLRALGRHLDAAPATVHAYVRLRVSHLLLGGGLLAGLAVAAGLLGGLGLARPGGLALCALWLAGVMALLLSREALDAQLPAIGPLGVALWLLAAWLPAAALGWWGDALPRADVLPRLGLAAGVAVLLLSGLLFDALGLLATRAHGVPPQPGVVATDEVHLPWDADPTQMFRDIDLELHRRWTEGVPNRRHTWLPPQIDSDVDRGLFEATVLEESQPLTPSAAPAALPERRRALLLLDSLGLLWTLAGGAFWLWAAWSHVRDAGASWTSTSVGLACLLAGSYALHVAHLLWSRVEVESTITWLEFKGRWRRLAAAVPGTDGAPAVLGDGVTLTASVARARSVFYAAAAHELGSRTLLTLEGQPAQAQGWTQYLQELGRKAAASSGLSPADAAERLKARERRPPLEPRGAVPVARRMARFCSDCGTPVLAGAKFCQQCGNVLVPD